MSWKEFKGLVQQSVDELEKYRLVDESNFINSYLEEKSLLRRFFKVTYDANIEVETGPSIQLVNNNHWNEEVFSAPKQIRIPTSAQVKVNHEWFISYMDKNREDMLHRSLKASASSLKDIEDQYLLLTLNKLSLACSEPPISVEDESLTTEFLEQVDATFRNRNKRLGRVLVPSSERYDGSRWHIVQLDSEGHGIEIVPYLRDLFLPYLTLGVSCPYFFCSTDFASKSLVSFDKPYAVFFDPNLLKRQLVGYYGGTNLGIFSQGFGDVISGLLQ